MKIHASPDAWDRQSNVDFFVEVNGRFLGLQIKPVATYAFITQIVQEQQGQAATHALFAAKFGGSVFYVYSSSGTAGKEKVIQNIEAIEAIRAEIERLNAGI